MTSREFRDRLGRRVRRVGLSPSQELTGQLEIYYRLLTIWNKKINLAGFDLEDPSPEALDRLLVEPLVAARHVPSTVREALDVGSGGGSPAIPLLLAIPSIRLLLVEAKTRKSVFLVEVIRALGLATVATVVSTRFEELLTRPDLHEKHDLLTLRAVRVESRTLRGLQAFLKPGGTLFLFRGVGGLDAGELVHPPLSWRATYPLLEVPPSRLMVFEKRSIGRR